MVGSTPILNLLRFALLASVTLFLGAHAHSQHAKRCLGTYFESIDLSEEALSIDQSDGQRLVSEIVESFGINREIDAVPCENPLVKVIAFPTSALPERGIPAGEYIIYNPTWVREVIGQQRVQAIALMGHEIGHYFQGHFSSASTLTRLEKETEADYLAGCAVARMSGDWKELEEFLRRIRSPFGGGLYPTADESVEVAMNGFVSCDGVLEASNRSSPIILQECDECPSMRRIDGLELEADGFSFYAGITEITVGQFATFARARSSYFEDRAEQIELSEESCFAAGEWVGFSSFDELGVAPRDWNNPGYIQSATHPVVCITYEDAQEYIKWLNSLETSSGTYRLPTEGEWEAMAALGLPDATDREFYLTQACRLGNVADLTAKAFDFEFVQEFASCNDFSPRTARVGSSAQHPEYLEHPNGLLDLYGNVFEFISECGEEPAAILLPDGTIIQSTDEDSCGARIVKGGSWERTPYYIRPRAKTKVAPSDRMNFIGFRVVMDKERE